MILFDVNGNCGRNACGVSEFPDPAARLEFMNRFNIARSLVWNIEAVRHHAGAANSALLAELAAVPAARGRLIPAFCVSGLMAYESGAIGALLEQMQASGSNALRFVNFGGSIVVLQSLAPVISKLRSLNPFLVLRHEESTAAELAALAAEFPWLPIILTEIGWPACLKVFELMRRHRNIMADTSWLHTCGAIEMAAKHFGAERLVFGTGLKSHNGAAIAALARADISDAQRRLIASGNLERLTGLKPLRAVRETVWRHNTFWPRFLKRKPLNTAAIDAHGHLGPSAGYVLERQAEPVQLALALKTMEAAGINTMILSGMEAILGDSVKGNDQLESILKPHTNRFKGYVAFNPFFGRELAACFKRYFAGPVFVGFKTLCDYWGVPITDPRFRPMWEYAERHRLPVLNHTWQGTLDSPALLAEIVQKYPNVQFILGHSGGGDRGRLEAKELAARHRNVFLEWCGSFHCARPWEETLRVVGSRQVVFGTDAMAHEINWELGRLLSLAIGDAPLKAILGGNMRRILAMRR